MGGPLHGIKVLDLTRLLPGGYCTQVMADLGADVIKVEEPERGDPLRRPADLGDYSSAHWVLNRNKRSIAIDLKAPGGAQVLLRLAESAQVLVEGFRPGVADRLGVGYRAVSASNPAIVYCSISGYGQDGPLRRRAGHDVNYLATSGVLSITGTAAQGPVIPGVQMADLGGGLLAATGILAALLHASATGEGEHVDVSMSDGMVSWLSIHAGGYWSGSTEPGPESMLLNGGFPCYRVYRCADDRFVALGALEDRFWIAFVERAGRPEWAERARDPSLIREAEALFSERTRDEWVAHFAGEDCCLSPVLDLEEALSNPQFRARRMVVSQAHGRSGQLRQLGVPIKLYGNPGSLRRSSPQLGEHTAEVLRQAGFTEKDVDALLREDVVRVHGSHAER